MNLPGINNKWRFFTHWPSFVSFESRNVPCVSGQIHLLQVPFTQVALRLSQLRHPSPVRLSQFGLSNTSGSPLSMFSRALNDKTKHSTIRKAKTVIHLNFSNIMENVLNFQSIKGLCFRRNTHIQPKPWYSPLFKVEKCNSLTVNLHHKFRSVGSDRLRSMAPFLFQLKRSAGGHRERLYL